MAKIIIEITQPKGHCGVVALPEAGAVATALHVDISVEGDDRQKLATLVADKLADVYTATIQIGIKAAVDSVLKESIQDKTC
ncbi:hypothetical protein [Vibrio parahaemolyticus]|uniref:hypothetical protein n=1 Tax=Vibrio parahaemolyticus TaxID=670 RepID=UPI002807B5A0|nr:hypothetical protein [Vibrio parahaemolyticus]EGR0696871.1 hypothetical protein [Vibrio parahaemolyticus]EGR3251779.1 hypothetical protein [Vibrio parahaemolyticus]ELA7934583.1 hypothetical protein [Vibrio parahaemolyticus]MDS1996416.1 hypothetical protein [Vibrio parahaemolyticus]MDS1996528.1 hypothetical protein [Vibrio parahaemolyticus]